MVIPHPAWQAEVSTGPFGVIGPPWGGYKSSGSGRTMSAESVLDYTQLTSVILSTAD